MKKLFFLGFFSLIIFEFMNVFYLMPLPGSQETDAVSTAYFLYSWRWFFRIMSGLLILIGAADYFRNPYPAETNLRWIKTRLPILIAFGFGYFIYVFNFNMSAESIFLPVKQLEFKNQVESEVASDRLIIGVEINGEAKAYPIDFLAYHHQVRDEIGGKEVMVTYCSVCRTGRVYEPLIDAKTDDFRIVGMDQFNAMFEDSRTGSWWRQSTGEAVAGELKGTRLPNVPSVQMTISQWLKEYPDGLIMQEDPNFSNIYDSLGRYEKGESTSALTGTDHESWGRKSWVVGIELNGKSKAYDWNQLKEQRTIHDVLGGTPIVIALANDDMSFVVYERGENQFFKIDEQNQLVSKTSTCSFSGRCDDGCEIMHRVQAHQEFWHSWQSFHPTTEKYE